MIRYDNLFIKFLALQRIIAKKSFKKKEEKCCGLFVRVKYVCPDNNVKQEQQIPQVMK